MSKLTSHRSIAKPVLVGGLILTVGVLAATAIRKRQKASETTENLFQHCENALATLRKRSRSVAA
jgi:hypothetical protein